MTPPEVCQEVADRIAPQLQELGLNACLICGYVEDGNGKVSKVTMGWLGNNPAYADGLRNLQALAEQWGRGEL